MPQNTDGSNPCRPNFFIVGAPKSGTTALSEYLRHHPEILFSEPKEPNFFNTDFSRTIESLDSYLDCFSHGTGAEKAVGEASVFYLYSKTAVSNILEFDPRSRIIVMLRNPVEAVYSWHWQVAYVYGGDLEDLEVVWHARGGSHSRRFANSNNLSPDRLDYGSLFSYANQLSRLFQQVPRERVHVILYDDFDREPAGIYAETVNFLGLSPFALASYPRLNASKRYRSGAARRVIESSAALQRRSNIKGFGLLGRLQRWNTRHSERPPLTEAFRSELIEYFHSDISRTSEILGRDLSHWYDSSKRLMENPAGSPNPQPESGPV